MYTIGIDVHQRWSNVCILNRKGERFKEQRVETAELAKFIACQPGPRQIVYEASLGYGTLHDRLQPLAQRIVVAHPGHLRLIFRSKRKNDRLDARKLATLLLLDEVPPVYVPNVDYRNWRRLIEFRQRLVNDRTRTKNSLRSLLRSHAIETPFRRTLWTRKGLAWLQAVALPTPDVALERDLLLEDLTQHNTRLKRVDARLKERADAHPGVALLRTIPGVGIRTAEAVMAYIVDPHRFATSRQVGSYFGLVPCQDQSADRNRLGHITRQGPATVRRLLVEAAWVAIRKDERVRNFFEQVQRNDPQRKKIALVATAHYLVRCMHALLRTGECWRTADQAVGGRKQRGTAA
jgi:transposase